MEGDFRAALERWIHKRGTVHRGADEVLMHESRVAAEKYRVQEAELLIKQAKRTWPMANSPSYPRRAEWPRSSNDWGAWRGGSTI